MKNYLIAFFCLASAVAASGAWISASRACAKVEDLSTQGIPAAEVTLLELHSLDDFERTTSEVETLSAADMAAVVEQIDSWFFNPEDENVISEKKIALLEQLRDKVTNEVQQLHEAALEAPTFSQGAERLSEAGAILALFPISEDESVLQLARTLSYNHTLVRTRLQILQRQRYNAWAVGRIEAALKGFEENKSYLSPKDENPKLMESLSKEIGEVDPALLEPIVLDLYEYVIEKTKKNISEKDKIDLAKMLTDSNTQRKTLGDF